jgi:hypothetical protein
LISWLGTYLRGTVLLGRNVSPSNAIDEFVKLLLQKSLLHRPHLHLGHTLALLLRAVCQLIDESELIGLVELRQLAIEFKEELEHTENEEIGQVFKQRF